MWVKRLRLRWFRNYALLDQVLSPGATLLVGDNAQGKTNLLEAVLLLCVGRSHRTPRERELIYEGASFSIARIDMQRAGIDHRLELRMRVHGNRQVLLDDVPAKKIGELMGRLNAVLFSPEDLKMIKEGPSERRRFVDMELSQLRPAYFYAIQRYRIALKQRQRVLAEWDRNPSLRATIEDWDEQLAVEGVTIMSMRRAFIEELSRTASGHQLAMTGGREQLGVLYQPALEGDVTKSAYLDALARKRAEDIRRKTTHVGPHRDDIVIAIDGRDARVFASQGQQRTAALALRLSEVDIIRAATGDAPVLMLDDVFSELDEHRRHQLLASIRGAQVLITATDVLRVPELGRAQVLRVTAGKITPED